MIHARLLTGPQVAALLGRSVSWFYRNRTALEDKEFPRAVDACGMRWDVQAVNDWITRQGRLNQAPEISAEQILIDRARQMAAAE